MITYIYALKCPISGDIKYIGKANDPKKRFREHLRMDRTACSHKKNWIKSLLKKNLTPEMEVLEKVDLYNWKDRERYYIAKYRKLYKLTNYTDGGEGSFKGNQTSFKKGQKSWNKGTRKKKPCATCDKPFEVSPTGDKKYKCCSIKCSLVHRSKYPNKGTFKKGHAPWNKGISGYRTSRYKEKVKTVKLIQQFKDEVLIGEYNSIIEAANSTGIGRTSINNALTGYSKSAGGFKWERNIIKC